LSADEDERLEVGVVDNQGGQNGRRPYPPRATTPGVE
jgi:hypothetical protein